MPPPLRTLPTDYHYYAYDNDQATPWTPGTAQPNRGNYQFYSMLKDLQALQVWGTGRNVPNIAFANLGAGIRVNNSVRRTMMLSLGAAAGPAVPAVVITGGIHAREWIAPAMAYLLAEYLVRNYNAAPVTPFEVALRNLINNRRIFIVPMLNPQGNSYTVYNPAPNARMWRKNRRALPMTTPGWVAVLTTPAGPNPPFQNVAAAGPAPTFATYDVPVYQSAATSTVTIASAQPLVGVDLNRNCTTGAWGHETAGSTEGDPTQEDYFGPRIASERETQNIELQLAAIPGGPAAPLATSVDYHSYGKYILYPTEADNTGAVNANYTALGKILQVLIRPAAAGWSYDYSLGTPHSLLGYDAVGTLGDHMALTYNTRAFVIELDPRGGAGFQLPENQIQTVFEKNIRGALALIAAAGRPSAVQQTWRWGTRTINSTEAQFVGWNVWGRGNQLP